MPRCGFVSFKLVDTREAFLVRTARYVALEHALVLLQMRPVVIVSYRKMIGVSIRCMRTRAAEPYVACSPGSSRLAPTDCGVSCRISIRT